MLDLASVWHGEAAAVEDRQWNSPTTEANAAFMITGRGERQ